MKYAINLLLSILVLVYATAQEQRPKQVDSTGKEETYIPKDLADAVCELGKLIRSEDKELIKKGEIESGEMHFGLGMGLRNSWGLWVGSRLAVYFKEQGITHPDSMSSYILDAFCRNLRGQKYDLLSIMRENAKEWPTFQQPVEGDGDEQVRKREAVLFHKFDYDEKEHVVSTSLLWNPDDGKIYLEKASERRLATDPEIKQFRESKEGWNFRSDEEKTLEDLRAASESERLVKIKSMTEEQRSKFDGLLPRATDPEGIDKLPSGDPFAEPSPKAEQDGGGQPATRPESNCP